MQPRGALPSALGEETMRMGFSFVDWSPCFGRARSALSGHMVYLSSLLRHSGYRPGGNYPDRRYAVAPVLYFGGEVLR